MQLPFLLLLLASFSLALPLDVQPSSSSTTTLHKRYVKKLSETEHADKLAGVRLLNGKHKRSVQPSSGWVPLKDSAAASKAVNQPQKRQQELVGDTGLYASTHRVPLKRGQAESEQLVQRGVLDPRLYYVQHVNHALARRERYAGGRDLQKRADLRDQLRAEAEERMRKRWIDIHQEEGLQAPALKLGKRGRLEGLLTNTNMFGVNRGMANDLAAVNSQASGSGAGFDPTLLAIATAQSITEPENDGPAGSAGLSIQGNNIAIFAEMALGSQGTKFNILMDSGSADFWVPSEVCNDDGTCGGHQTLGATNSNTFQATQQPWSITYGTGEAAGVIVQDTVALGDGSLSQKQNAFGVTTFESEEFSSGDIPFDGLMGLAQSTLSEQSVPTFIENLASNGAVAAAQVGYNIADVLDPVANSEITFGGVDTSLFDGSLTEFDNLSNQGFWTGGLEAVTLDGQNVTGVQATSAILDTGTSLITAPQQDAVALHAAIPGAVAADQAQTQFLVPCTNQKSLAFQFGGKSFAMEPQDLAFLPVDVNNLQGMCQSAISAGEVDNQGSWLVGDAFLKRTYFATDVGRNKMGLATKVKASGNSGAAAAGAVQAYEAQGDAAGFNASNEEKEESSESHSVNPSWFIFAGLALHMGLQVGM